MFGNKKDTISPKISTASSHNSLVSGTTITGSISSTTDIRIDGKLEGTLNCEAKVVIGKNALILGDIFCQSILIEGKIEGNITAKEKLHIQSSGNVVGNLTTKKLIIEDGAVFNGASIMGKASLKQKKYDRQGELARESDKKVQKAS
jgi:cytoskeletal protein CcmA (bactofilin family)